jgi:hypothetical protein
MVEPLPSFLEGVDVDVPKPGVGIPGQGVDFARDGHAGFRVRREVRDINAVRLEEFVQGLRQADEIADLGGMHDGDIGHVPRGEASCQLLVVRSPLDDLRLDDDVVLVGRVEHVHQRGDHAALAARLRQIGVGSVVGIAGPEETGQCDLGLLLRQSSRGRGCQQET